MTVLSDLRSQLNRVTKGGGDKLESSYLVNRAFERYRSGKYEKVPSMVLRAWGKDPSYLTNRGVLSIFLRSMARTVFG